MADQLDSNTRSPNPDAEIDDPLAELARIIGYERPAEPADTVSEEPQLNELDLEAELMRELDVPQQPAIDDLDLLEADEAIGEQAAIDEVPVAEPEVTGAPFAIDDELVIAGEEDAQDPWLEYDESESSDWVATEPAVADTPHQVSEVDFSIDEAELLSADEAIAAAGDQLDVEEASETAVDWDSIETDVSVGAPEAAQAYDEPGEVVVADFNTGRAAPGASSTYNDDVLADMDRFELPEHLPVGSGQPEGQSQQPDTGNADVFETIAETSDFDAGLAGFDVPAADEPDAGPDMPEPAAHAPVEYTDDASLDFEEYLSTELDVFGHEMAIDNQNPPQQPVAEADAGYSASAETTDRDNAGADEQTSVFDDAAEELLADIALDDVTDPTEVEPVEAADDWSVDSIDDAVAEELDEELEDMFGVPDPAPYPPAAHASESDEFDLDLDQVLAESSVETNAARDGGMDQTLAASGAAYGETEDSAAFADEPVEPVLSERDEMAEAFLGLIPAEDETVSPADLAQQPESGGDLPAADPGAGDEDNWLAGFETSDAAAQSAGDEYYFDAGLISEPEETVEPVAVFDVPELEQDEPQPADLDYDTEIEREFADIIDRREPDADVATAAVAAGSAPREEWSRREASPRGLEVSEDYIALERELDAGEDVSDAGFDTSEFDDDELANDPYDREQVMTGAPERTTGARGPVLALTVLGVALLAGVGAFGWSLLSGGETSEDGGPRIIRADTDPVKVLPENPGGVTVPNQDKAVYDRVAGGDATPAGQPALVNSAEEPVDVVQRTLDPEILPLEGRGESTDKSEDRLAANAGTDADTAGSGVSGPVVSPRKVRTMIVKPDGSIVAREDPAPEPTSEPALAQAEPAASQNLLAAPEADATPAVDSAEPVEQAATDVAAPVAVEQPVATDEAEQTSIAPVRVVKTQQIRPVANAPIPQGRPADQPVNVVGTVTQAGNVAAAPAPTAAPAQPVEVATAPAAAAPAAPAAAAPAAANPGGYYVQIASQPSAEGAQASWQTLSGRYSSVLGGRSVDIQRADIPGKGVFHRVRVPGGTRDQANALCSRYKAAGGSCFVSR